MKEQTALQELIGWVDTFQPYGLSRADVRRKATELLTKEREQIEQAYDTAWDRGYDKSNYDGSTTYFTATYKQPL